MSKYYEKLESLRGLAALAIVLFHSPFYKLGKPNDFVANSSLFVDCFFILSGFVMTNAYLEKIADGFKFRDYFLLRLGRIYPLHLVLLLVWAIYVVSTQFLFAGQIAFENPILKNTFGTFLMNLLLVHSLNTQILASWNYPSWSISLEFFTYFIFFGFAILTQKLRNPLFALILSVASYFYIFNQTNWQTLDFTLNNGIFRCCGGFFAGVFLFQATTNLRKLNHYLTTILEIVSVGLVFWIVSNAQQSNIFLFSVIPTFVFLVYVLSLEKDGLIGKILKLKPFTNLGKYSYSIYLNHALILGIVFSLTKYFIIKPTEQIYYYQTDWSYLINIGLVMIIYAVSSLTYKLIEKVWLEKSKNYVKSLILFRQT